MDDHPAHYSPSVGVVACLWPIVVRRRFHMRHTGTGRTSGILPGVLRYRCVWTGLVDGVRRGTASTAVGVESGWGGRRRATRRRRTREERAGGRRLGGLVGRVCKGGGLGVRRDGPWRGCPRAGGLSWGWNDVRDPVHGLGMVQRHAAVRGAILWPLHYRLQTVLAAANIWYNGH